MKPDGVPGEPGSRAEEQREGTGTQVRDGDGQNVRGKNRAGEPVVIFRGAKGGVAVTFVDRYRSRGSGDSFVEAASGFRSAPHADQQPFVIPPVHKSLPGFSPVRFPHIIPAIVLAGRRSRAPTVSQNR